MKNNQNHDDQLDKLVSSHYNKLELRNTKLESLLAMSEHSSSKPENKPNSNFKKPDQQKFWQRSLAIAATLLIFTFATVKFLQPTQTNNIGLSMLITKEVALNHNKGLHPEFTTTDFDTLASEMSKLDFIPTQPTEVNINSLRLIGARYCSIQGQLASQIKLLDTNGELVTLYQTQLNNDLDNLPEASYQADGVTVQQWREAGLFFSLAKSI